MFLLDDGALCSSPSDLRLAAECEFALLRQLDERLGRAAPHPAEPDPVLRRAAELGDAHERLVLLTMARAHPGRVVQFPARSGGSRTQLEEAHASTLHALSSGAAVVYQAAFFDGRFLGYADFLVREGELWTVCDTKLARHESVPALLQIAAYADLLRSAGVPTSPTARLILGDDRHEDFPLTDILPVYRERRERLAHVLEEHHRSPEPVAWGDPRWLACGRCEQCAAELEARSDVLLVAGLRVSQRKKLAAAGVRTMTELAEPADRTAPVPGLAGSTLERLRQQARLQLAQEADGTVRHELSDADALRVLPAPSEGDIFFDFEGDPMWSEHGSGDWGLEYLFGAMVGGADGPQFHDFWAHDRAQEKQALVDFVAWVGQRRRRWPDLHIYHYAAYERSALLRLAARHGVCEAEVDQLLSDGVLVDLYAVVRAAVRVSQRSYSIKKLEPLYMDADLREGEVTTAGDSIVVYHEYCRASDLGEERLAAQLLRGIRDYNEYDCLSTLRLRDWLLARAAEAGVEVGAVPGPESDLEEADPLETRLREHVGQVRRADRTVDEQAVAMLAAAVQFNRREHKPFWWGHFDRLRNPVDEWVAGTDVFLVDSGEAVGEWHRQGRQNLRRHLRLVGHFAAGSTLRPGAKVTLVYEPPVPSGVPVPRGALRGARECGTISERSAEDGQDVVVIEEVLAKGAQAFEALPVALAPCAPPRTDSIDAALHELGEQALAALPSLPEQAGVDLLRRLPPRLRGLPTVPGTTATVGGPRVGKMSGGLPPVGEDDDRFVQAITAALLALDHSYLAVQGPPGAGKTHVGSHVIARLVTEHGWRVGVCAQSHSAIEHVLDAVVRAGVDAKLVGKEPKDSSAEPTWTALRRDELPAFATAREATGYVIGGTAWDFTNTKRVRREQLDLLVIDEAGQYALATTLACSTATSRLLLLGDPQQLPQVSVGTHPEPVDGSALGWILDGAATIPPDRGYFLDTTWRMHPALTARVSTLSYAGQLRSHETVTGARRLAGLDAGLHVVTVAHWDNSTESAEEAHEVLEQVQRLLGTAWTERGDDAAARPLEQRDLLVVAPYNQQVNRIRAVLDAAGMGEVPVGTVDKFQGREAVVVIVSMTASARTDVPRGIGFLLDRNRLNVSVSRAQWATILVRSDVLTDFSPATPAELLALGAFIGLCAPEPEA